MQKRVMTLAVLLGALALSFPSVTFASNNNDSGNNNGPQNNNTNVTQSTAVNQSTDVDVRSYGGSAHQGQTQGQIQGQYQGQEANSDSYSKSNLNYTNINPRNPVSSAFAPDTNDNCRTKLSLGLQMIGVGGVINLPLSGNICARLQIADKVGETFGVEAKRKYMCEEIDGVKDAVGEAACNSTTPVAEEQKSYKTSMAPILD